VWVPDWPVTALGGAHEEPFAVLDSGGRVLACSGAARAAGVRRGQRARDAQLLSPQMVVRPRDLAREAREFEPVVAVLEELAAGVEMVRPGLIALDSRGPARFYGGELELAERVRNAVGELSTAEGDEIGCGAGLADGIFAAALAARRDLVIEPAGSAAFLAPMPLRVLERPELAGTLDRLGVRSVGAFAKLPAADVANRFGVDGIEAHRLARGLDPRPPAHRVPPEDYAAVHEFEEPAERDEQVTFVAKMLADQLYERLGSLGLACTRLGIEAETVSGRLCARLWRLGGATGRPSSVGTAERCRWQLDGWRTREPYPVADPVALLRLVPDQLVVDTGAQQALWGVEEVPGRVAQAAERVQAMLGIESVTQLQLVGARDPAAMVRHVPWGEQAEADPNAGAPWPGAIPAPYPSVVPGEPIPVQLLDERGREVEVSGRAQLSAPPAVLVLDRQRLAVAGYAGPWPYDERPWSQTDRARRARLQCATSDGRAWLLARSSGRWQVEGVYQ
jgi:protein ImuB